MTCYVLESQILRKVERKNYLWDLLWEKVWVTVYSTNASISYLAYF